MDRRKYQKAHPQPMRDGRMSRREKVRSTCVGKHLKAGKIRLKKPVKSTAESNELSLNVAQRRTEASALTELRRLATTTGFWSESELRSASFKRSNLSRRLLQKQRNKKKNVKTSPARQSFQTPTSSSASKESDCKDSTRPVDNSSKYLKETAVKPPKSDRKSGVLSELRRLQTTDGFWSPSFSYPTSSLSDPVNKNSGHVATKSSPLANTSYSSDLRGLKATKGVLSPSVASTSSIQQLSRDDSPSSTSSLDRVKRRSKVSENDKLSVTSVGEQSSSLDRVTRRTVGKSDVSDNVNISVDVGCEQSSSVDRVTRRSVGKLDVSENDKVPVESIATQSSVDNVNGGRKSRSALPVVKSKRERLTSNQTTSTEHKVTQRGLRTKSREVKEAKQDLETPVRSRTSLSPRTMIEGEQRRSSHKVLHHDSVGKEPPQRHLRPKKIEQKDVLKSEVPVQRGVNSAAEKCVGKNDTVKVLEEDSFVESGRKQRKKVDQTDMEVALPSSLDVKKTEEKMRATPIIITKSSINRGHKRLKFLHLSDKRVLRRKRIQCGNQTDSPQSPPSAKRSRSIIKSGLKSSDNETELNSSSECNKKQVLSSSLPVSESSIKSKSKPDSLKKLSKQQTTPKTGVVSPVSKSVHRDAMEMPERRIPSRSNPEMSSLVRSSELKRLATTDGFWSPPSMLSGSLESGPLKLRQKKRLKSPPKSPVRHKSVLFQHCSKKLKSVKKAVAKCQNLSLFKKDSKASNSLPLTQDEVVALKKKLVLKRKGRKRIVMSESGSVPFNSGDLSVSGLTSKDGEQIPDLLHQMRAKHKEEANPIVLRKSLRKTLNKDLVKEEIEVVKDDAGSKQSDEGENIFDIMNKAPQFDLTVSPDKLTSQSLLDVREENVQDSVSIAMKKIDFEEKSKQDASEEIKEEVDAKLSVEDGDMKKWATNNNEVEEPGVDEKIEQVKDDTTGVMDVESNKDKEVSHADCSDISPVLDSVSCIPEMCPEVSYALSSPSPLDSVIGAHAENEKNNTLTTADEVVGVEVGSESKDKDEEPNEDRHSMYHSSETSNEPCSLSSSVLMLRSKDELVENFQNGTKQINTNDSAVSTTCEAMESPNFVGQCNSEEESDGQQVASVVVDKNVCIKAADEICEPPTSNVSKETLSCTVENDGHQTNDTIANANSNDTLTEKPCPFMTDQTTAPSSEIENLGTSISDGHINKGETTCSEDAMESVNILPVDPALKSGNSALGVSCEKNIVKDMNLTAVSEGNVNFAPGSPMLSKGQPIRSNASDKDIGPGSDIGAKLSSESPEGCVSDMGDARSTDHNCQLEINSSSENVAPQTVCVAVSEKPVEEKNSMNELGEGETEGKKKCVSPWKNLTVLPRSPSRSPKGIFRRKARKRRTNRWKKGVVKKYDHSKYIQLKQLKAQKKLFDAGTSASGAGAQADTQKETKSVARRQSIFLGKNKTGKQMLKRLLTQATFGSAPILDESQLLTRTKRGVLPTKQKTPSAGSNLSDGTAVITKRGRGRGIRRLNSEHRADKEKKLSISIPESTSQGASSLPLPVLKPLDFTAPTNASLDGPPPVLTPQFSQSFDVPVASSVYEDAEEDVVEEFVDESNFHLYWSDDEKSHEKKASPGKEKFSEIPTVSSLTSHRQPKKLKGKRGRPPGIKVARKAPKTARKTISARQTLYQPKITELVRTFEFRKKTTRSPLEMLEMKRRQEEAMYDLQEQKRRARLTLLREKRNARMSPEALTGEPSSSSDEDDDDFDIKPCVVVLNDFVKKLRLDGMFVPGFDDAEVTSSPFSLDYEDNESDEDWYADLEDIEEDDDDDGDMESSKCKRRPQIPRLKLKRVIRNQNLTNLKSRNLVSQLKSPDQEPLKLVIKTEPPEEIPENIHKERGVQAAKASSLSPNAPISPIDLTGVERTGFVGSYLDFLKERPQEGMLLCKPKKTKTIQVPKVMPPPVVQTVPKVTSAPLAQTVPKVTSAPLVQTVPKVMPAPLVQTITLSSNTNVAAEKGSQSQESEGVAKALNVQIIDIRTICEKTSSAANIEKETISGDSNSNVTESEPEKNVCAVGPLEISNSAILDVDQSKVLDKVDGDDNNTIKSVNTDSAQVQNELGAPQEGDSTIQGSSVESLGTVSEIEKGDLINQKSITSEIPVEAPKCPGGEAITTPEVQNKSDQRTDQMEPIVTTKHSTTPSTSNEAMSDLSNRHKENLASPQDVATYPTTPAAGDGASFAHVGKTSDSTIEDKSTSNMIYLDYTDNKRQEVEDTSNSLSSSPKLNSNEDISVRNQSSNNTHSNNNNNEDKVSSPSQKDCIKSPVHSTSSNSLVENDPTSKVKIIMPQDRLPSSFRYTCKRCGFTSLTKLTIESHVYSHIPGVQFQCATCQIEFSSMVAAATHLKNTHQVNNQQLHIIGGVDEASFYDKMDNPELAEQESDSVPSVSSQINSSAESQSSPFIISVVVSGGAGNRAARTGSSNQRRYVCSHCGFSTNVKDDIEQHVSDLHPSQGLYTCTLCDESIFSSEEDIRQHCTSVHPSRPKPYWKLPDFYDAAHLAKMTQQKNGQEEHGSPTNIFRVNSLLDVSDIDSTSTADHKQKAKEYLYMLEDWTGKKSVEADSTTGADYLEETSASDSPKEDAMADEVADDVIEDARVSTPISSTESPSSRAVTGKALHLKPDAEDGPVPSLPPKEGPEKDNEADNCDGTLNVKITEVVSLSEQDLVSADVQMSSSFDEGIQKESPQATSSTAVPTTENDSISTVDQSVISSVQADNSQLSNQVADIPDQRSGCISVETTPSSAAMAVEASLPPPPQTGKLKTASFLLPSVNTTLSASSSPSSSTVAVESSSSIVVAGTSSSSSSSTGVFVSLSSSSTALSVVTSLSSPVTVEASSPSKIAVETSSSISMPSPYVQSPLPSPLLVEGRPTESTVTPTTASSDLESVDSHQLNALASSVTVSSSISEPSVTLTSTHESTESQRGASSPVHPEAISKSSSISASSTPLTTATSSSSSLTSSSSSSSSPVSGGLPLSYKCIACKVHTPYLLMMVKHLKSRHSNIQCFSCPYCQSSSSFVSQKHLRHHVRSQHPSKVGKNEISLSKEANKLVEAMVLPYNSQCTRVGNRFVLEEDIHTCTLCSIRMTSMPSVYDHLKEKHSDLFEFICPVCQAYKSKSLQDISNHCITEHDSNLDKDKFHVSVPKYLFVVLKCISANGKYIEKALASPEAASTSKPPSSASTTTKTTTPVSSPLPTAGSAVSSASTLPRVTHSEVDRRRPSSDRTELHTSTSHTSMDVPRQKSVPTSFIGASSLSSAQQLQQPTSLALAVATPTGTIISPIVALPVNPPGMTVGGGISTQIPVSISSSLFDTSSLVPVKIVPDKSTLPETGGKNITPAASTKMPSHTLNPKSSKNLGNLPVLNVPSVNKRSSSLSAYNQFLQQRQQSGNSTVSSLPRQSSHSSSSQPPPASMFNTSSATQPHSSSTEPDIDQLPEDEPNPDAFKIFNLRPSASPAAMAQPSAPAVPPSVPQPPPPAAMSTGVPSVFPPVSSSSLALSFLPGPIAGFPAAMVIPPNLVHNAFPFAAANVRSINPGNISTNISNNGNSMAANTLPPASSSSNHLNMMNKMNTMVYRPVISKPYQQPSPSGYNSSQRPQIPPPASTMLHTTPKRSQQLVGQSAQQQQQQQNMQPVHQQQLLKNMPVSSINTNFMAPFSLNRAGTKQPPPPNVVPVEHLQCQYNQRTQNAWQQYHQMRQPFPSQPRQDLIPQPQTSAAVVAVGPAGSLSPVGIGGPGSAQSVKKGKRGSQMYQCPYCPRLVELRALDVASHIQQVHPGKPVTFHKLST